MKPNADKLRTVGCLTFGSAPKPTVPEMQLLNAGVRFIPASAFSKRALPSEVKKLTEEALRSIAISQLAKNWTGVSNPLAKIAKPRYDPFQSEEYQHPSNRALRLLISKMRADLPPLLTRLMLKTDTSPQNLTADQQLALEDVRQQEEYVMVKADKDRVFVKVMMSDYVKMAHSHLLTDTYRMIGHLDSSIVAARVRRTVAEARRLRTRHLQGPPIFNLEDADWLHFKNIIPHSGEGFDIPKFRLLIKTHKTPMSTRPIAGACNWITTKASELLTKLLLPHVEKIPVRLQNTDSLIRDLEHFNRSEVFREFPGILVGTADVTAMYPSIPVTEGLDALRWFCTDRFAPDEVDFIVDVAEWILRNNLIRFGDTIYNQEIGTAMGTNFAPLYADVVMWFQEEHSLIPFNPTKGGGWKYATESEDPQLSFWHRTSPDSMIVHKLPYLLYRRYIDDIFLVTPLFKGSKDKAIKTISRITDHSALTLSAIELDSEVPFLDLKVRVTEVNRLEWSLYKKPMVTNLFLPPFSQHAPAVTRGWMTAEFGRIMKRNSSPLIARPHVLDFFSFCAMRQAKWYDIKKAYERALNPPPKTRSEVETCLVPIMFNKSTMDLSIDKVMRLSFWTDEALASAAVGNLRLSPAYRTERNLEMTLLPKHSAIARFIQKTAVTREVDSSAILTEDPPTGPENMSRKRPRPLN